MSKEITIRDKNDITSLMEDIQNTQKVCAMLMNTPHYKKMGAEGVFAIVQKAISLAISPLEALNGGMYFVQGKVELSAILMAKLIRLQKHSYTLDKQSTNTCCILHGKRADNGDTWKVSFSVEDAKKAGIYKAGGPWEKYTDIMCYNRALSKLARQLFPDVIGNCYVEGEISMASPLFDQKTESINFKIENTEVEKPEVVIPSKDYTRITEDQAVNLDILIGDDHEYREQLLSFIKKNLKADSLSELPAEWYERVYNKAKQNAESKDEFIAVEA